MWLTTMARAAGARLQTSSDYYSFLKDLITQGGTEASSLKFQLYAPHFNNKETSEDVHKSVVYNINLWAHEVELGLANTKPSSWNNPGVRGLVVWNILASLPSALSKRWKNDKVIDSAGQVPHEVTWGNLLLDLTAHVKVMLQEQNPEKLAEAIRELLPQPKVQAQNVMVGGAAGAAPGGAAGGGPPEGGANRRKTPKCTTCDGKAYPWYHKTENCPLGQKAGAAIAGAAAPNAAGGVAAAGEERKCFRCADPAHLANVCPFMKYKCKLCNEVGHKENCCREDKRKRAAAAAAAASAAKAAAPAAKK